MIWKKVPGVPFRNLRRSGSTKTHTLLKRGPSGPFFVRQGFHQAALDSDGEPQEVLRQPRKNFLEKFLRNIFFSK